ncbi:hypothetical protein DPMN_012650 [Dreissena polymorpha]|uniref:Uncharacterized protein n=1 Tax=Dreissena polymorpha TaxID=45954 RepID=A0A9D4N682_DREPO|nr:hypothetical protein DPMN_012650 [Dreissena polymorpha]
MGWSYGAVPVVPGAVSVVPRAMPVLPGNSRFIPEVLNIFKLSRWSSGFPRFIPVVPGEAPLNPGRSRITHRRAPGKSETGPLP